MGRSIFRRAGMLFLLTSAAAFGQSPPATKPVTRPATAPAAVKNTPSTSQPAAQPPTMSFRFENAPIDVIVRELKTRFDLKISEPLPSIPGAISMNVPEPLNQAESINLLNSILIPMGYALMDMTRDGQTTSMQMMTLDKAKKTAPVLNISTPDAPATDPANK